MGMDLAAMAAITVVSRMFRRIERFCPPQEIRPPDWNLSLVLRCLSRPPFKHLKLASDKHITRKTFFLLVFASAKRVSELHAFLFMFVTSTVGDPLPSFFLTLWLRSRTLLFLTLASRSSRFSPLMTSLVVIETN